jgi:hypothetical protein
MADLVSAHARDFTRLETALPVQFRQIAGLFDAIPRGGEMPFVLSIRVLTCAGPACCAGQESRRKECSLLSHRMRRMAFG